MMRRPRSVPNLFLFLVVTLLAAACGGKDEIPPVPSSLQVLLEDGDTLAGDFEILSIESANMAADRSISFIASRTGLPSLNGVFRRTPAGVIETILTPDSPEGGDLSFATVRNLVMAQSGEFAFQVGDQLDDDGLFYSDGSGVEVVAITGGGGPLEGFRTLGELRIAPGGAVAFSDGISPCTVDSSGTSERVTCNLRLHFGFPGSVETIEVPNGMTNQKPSAIILQVNESGEFAVGLPARGSEPFVGLIRDGEFDGIITRRQALGSLGVVTAAKPRAIGATGAIAIDASFDTDGDTERDTNRILRYRDGQLTTVFSTGQETPRGTAIDLNAVAVDDSDRVYYTANYLADGEERDLLRVWDQATGVTQDIIWDRMWYGGKDAQNRRLEITEISQTRVLGDGTVLIVVTIGFFEDGTRRITSRQLLRWKDGVMETVLQSKSPIEGGTLVGFQIADLNRFGDLLLIGEINAKANRALLLLPREEVFGIASED